MTKTERTIYALVGPTRYNTLPFSLAIDLAMELLFVQNIAMDDIRVTRDIYTPVAKQLGKNTAAVSRQIVRLCNLCWDAMLEAGEVEQYLGFSIWRFWCTSTSPSITSCSMCRRCCFENMDALRRLVFGTGRRFSSISTSFVRDFCESLHGTPLDFMHLKQYTAKVIQNVRRTERSTAMMLSGSYYYIATARFYAGRYFAVPVFPSHEA